MQDRILELQQAIRDGKLDELKPLKKIDFSTGKFEANGITYYLETTLTVGRYCEFQILERELATGMAIKDLYDNRFKLREILNQTRFVDAAVLIDREINHFAKLNEKEPIALKLCTLFINEKDEDRGKWGNDIVVKKMEDWKASGIDVADFFAFALTIVPTLINLYHQFTLNTLELFGGAVEMANALTATQTK